jgi:hypothetical protein
MFTLIYILLSFFCGAGAMLHYSVVTGLIIWAASCLAVVAMGGTILGARSHGGVFTIGSVIFGCALLALTYWLSGKFSVGLFHYNISGLSWCLIGCAVGAWWGFKSRPEGKPD